MKKEYVLTDFISINPNYAFKYITLNYAHDFERNLPSRSGRIQNFSMTKQSLSKVKNAFTWLLLISDKKTVYSKKENKKFSFKLSFITLTLSAKQMHHDNFIKAHMLEPFLYWMSKYCNAKSYIWKAEAQGNGNIHFHITTNKFIHWRSVRAKWNKILSKHGYCKIFQDGTNDKGNSATQIKAVRKESQIARYMIKYFCKNETDKRPINGRLWAASTNLNQKNYVINEHSGCYDSFYSALNSNPNIKRIDKDFGSLHLWNKKIFHTLPFTVRSHFSARIDKLKKADSPKLFYTVESLY